MRDWQCECAFAALQCGFFGSLFLKELPHAIMVASAQRSPFLEQAPLHIHYWCMLLSMYVCSWFCAPTSGRRHVSTTVYIYVSKHMMWICEYVSTKCVCITLQVHCQYQYFVHVVIFTATTYCFFELCKIHPQNIDRGIDRSFFVYSIRFK